MKHNWTKETMGECAMVHMDQLLDRWHNTASQRELEQELGRIFKSYLFIKKTVE